MDLQRRLGVDIAMVLDECPPWPIERAAAEASWRRTLDWARRARAAYDGPGGCSASSRGASSATCASAPPRTSRSLGFEGTPSAASRWGALAGRHRVVEWTAPALPAGKPRYLMGVGYPADILHAVSHGIDLFDCVLPARNGRHGVLFTREGLIKIRNSRYKDDPRPVDPACGCPACTRVSRAPFCTI